MINQEVQYGVAEIDSKLNFVLSGSRAINC
jgi:hypothetical protein